MRIIGGKFKGRTLATPKGNETRPSSSQLRETLFNLCRSRIEDAEFLDLFAGSGSVGFEALSRGATSVTFVDRSKNALECLKKNAKTLEVHPKIYFGDVFDTLKRLSFKKSPFDIIFADPPYALGLGQKTLNFVETSSLLKIGGYLIIEEAKETPLIPKVLLEEKRRPFGRTLLYVFRKIST